MNANSHAKRIILNHPLPRLGQFIKTHSLFLPDAFRAYRIQSVIAAELGREELRSMRAKWEPQLPPIQRGKWMTGRDMRRGVKLALLLGLDRLPRQGVLDIGCGTGFFLHVCRQFGHSILGFDLPHKSMFKEWTEFLRIPRVGERIEAFKPLPPMGQKFDLITMDSVTFDRDWSGEEWYFLLDNMRGHLRQDGRIYIMMKYSGKSRLLCNEEIAEIFGNIPGFETEFLNKRQMILTRVEEED
ncbi:MAG: class I SAM-dependent methyltransferase [Ignavibacteria bacterium]|nr:class I SAM-dependent methyltransferase [Ignavibacteria bacterium]